MPSLVKTVTIDGHCTFDTSAGISCNGCSYTGTTEFVGEDASISVLNRAYMEFDTSSIPDDATVTNVAVKTRTLTHSSSRGYSPTYRVKYWSRNYTIGAALTCADTGGVWTTQGQLLWANDNETRTKNLLDPTAINLTGDTVIRITHTWTPTGSQFALLTFASLEHATSSYHPEITITYTVPSGLVQRTLIGVGV